MGQGLDLTINRLPARTWNWLRMNEADLKQIEAGESPTVITEGFGEAEPWNEDISVLPTGMGEDMDRLAGEAGTAAIRIQSGPLKEKKRAALHFVCSDGGKNFQPVELLVREGECLTVIMDFTSPPEAAGLAAVQTRFQVNKNGRLKLIQLQLLGSGYRFLNDIGGRCEEDGAAEVVQLFLGGSETYAGCRADLAGRDSVLNADIGYLGRGNQRFDMNYTADHRGERSSSRILAGGVLRDRAFKLFRGTIDFKSGAVGAEGEEKEDVLLFGDDVVNQTIPLILCAEEDVLGSHGATIGRLDEELLFYLCSRGMSREEAEAMITRARLEAVCRKSGDEAAEQMVHNYLKEVKENGKQESIS
ncbi:MULTISPECIES: SufD family Fe-S cluster assembly protein [Hungatella]|uniref:SufB/SufD family protein n=1 Tax=Hungatella TaxID=1649459 RepID=UPI00258EB229|nr:MULTISPECIES: SufD family Fe-S cluster assembly protein [Hungatella]MCI6451935.1 SufD family Fe-S cluster assembly protein [Hungatella sp.]